jgi:hypothetical protein
MFHFLHSHLDICEKQLLASEYENISKRLNDISAMESLALNKRQRSKHQPAPSIDTEKRHNRHFKRRSRVINNSHTVVEMFSYSEANSCFSHISK